jgi:hypothetical protein
MFVSGVLPDTHAEREYLDKFMFPRLRELCASRGVSLKAVDLLEKMDGEDAAPEDVLHLTLEELQRSRPYYIGLIGEDYGKVIEQFPDELLSRWPALAQYRGRSTIELEIVFGVLRDEAMYGRGFFYFRDPKFTHIFPDIKTEGIGKGVGRSSNDARKLDELKQSIRDFSQQGICRLSENYRSFQEFGAWILNDFQQLIDALWPAPETRTEVQPYDDDVMFTVFRPETVIPQKWYSLLTFAHLSKRRPDAPADEPDPVAEVHRQAELVLGEKIVEYRESSQESGSSVPQAGEITFQPFIEGFEFNPTTRSFRWEESVHREEFKLRTTTAPDGEVARGWLRVYLGPLILAQVNLSLRVNSKFVSQDERKATATESVRPLRKVFASYSHKDEAIVERIEEIVSHTHLGIEYLRDIEKLRAGEVWSPRLMEMIREAQAFQLFWSTNSMHSKFVRQEYEYALGLHRKDFILPVFWETPFPENPEDGLPPDELRRLHFEKMATSISVRDRSRKRRRRVIAGQRTNLETAATTSEVTVPLAGVSTFDTTVSSAEAPRIAFPASPTVARTTQKDTYELRASSSTVSRRKSNALPLLLVLVSAATVAGLMFSVQLISKKSSGPAAASATSATPTPQSEAGTGLLFITHPVDGALLKVNRVGDKFETVISGRCDKEIWRRFEIWVLIRPENDSRFWLQHPPAIVDRSSNTWQARVVFGDTEHPWLFGRRFDIVAIAIRSDSDISSIRSTPNLELLPSHARSDVVTVTIDR